MARFLIELGIKAKSNISGFKGMVVGRAEHVNGCNRYMIQPPVDKEGKLPDGYWFDEAELVVVSKPKLKKKNADRGGPPSIIK